MRKKVALYFIVLFVSILFIVPSGIDNNIVSGATEQFEIKDTFETQINNRIYTEYDNYTIGEYFRDYIGDSADFTEDKEDFTIDGTDNGVSNGYFEWIALDDYDSIDTPIINLTEYSIGQMRVWMNVSTVNFLFYYRDYLDNSIGLSDYFGVSANTWKIINFTIPHNYVDDVRKIRFQFASGHNDYPVLCRVDYVRFWKGNLTDYAFQSGDSWDFGEGDTENSDFSFAGESVSADEELKVTPDGTKTNTYDYFTISDVEYNNVEFLFFSDFQTTGTQANYIFVRMHDFNNNYIQKIIYDFIDGQEYIITLSQNDYTSKSGDFDINTIKNFQIYVRSLVGNLAIDDFIYIDYILLYHDDLEDTETHKIQDTSSYRAYRGINSFISNIPNNVTYYEGFTANTNCSIKIDVPALEFFPEKIQLAIYMTTYFNLSLHIGSSSFILYESNLFLNEWLFISKSIYRYNYLLNDTTDNIYFEITYNSTDTQNIFYIDELNIKYTEPPQLFINSFDTGTGTHLDGFIYNHTNNYFHSSTSGEYLNSFSVNSLGVSYHSNSTNLFSRRMFNDYTVECDEIGVNIFITQQTDISLDKDYRLITEFVNSASSYTDFNNRLIWVKQYLYEDGVLIRNYQSEVYGDFILAGFNDLTFSVRVQQEDYSTISVANYYTNKLTGNNTDFSPFAFNVNEGSVKNSVMMVNISTNVMIRPSVVGVSFPDIFYHNSNPIITVKIAREIKHSDIVDSNININLPVSPEWRGGIYALADIWNYCVYYVTIFIIYVIDFFKQSMYLRDILKGIGDFFATFKDYWTNLVGYLSDFLSALGEIESIGDFISLVISTIATHLQNVFNTLVLMVADIISSIGDIIDGDLLGFPVLDDIIDAWEAFVLRDWTSFSTAWSNIIPEITEDTIGFVLFIPDWFLSLWLDDVNFLSTLVINGLKISKEVFLWITILVIMYMVYFMQLVIKRDFDRIRIEVTTIVNAINWIIDGIVFIFHWIFELLHAVLDVTIPFT